MNKIKYVSLFFRFFFQIIFVCVLAAQVFGWVYVNPAYKGYFSVIPGIYHGLILHQISADAKIAGFLVSMLQTSCQLLVIYFLINLFRLYERLEIFTMKNVQYIRYVGYALLFEEIFKPIVEFLLGFVLTASNPPGFRIATITFTEKNAGMMLTALIIILISWIMAEGTKLHEEQELTI